MSNKEKKALNQLTKGRNVEICVNDTDKNLGAISADKNDVVLECRRQLYDVITYNKVSWEEAKNLIDKIKFDLKRLSKTYGKRIIISKFLHHLEIFKESDSRNTNCGRIQLDFNTGFNFRRHSTKRFLQ